MTDMSLEAHGFPGRGGIFPLQSLELVIQAGDHPWLVAHRPEIAENWKREISNNPKLFDGNMVFQHRLHFRNGRIEGEGYLTPFSAFLHWRGHDRPEGGLHLFAMPLTMSSDGALIAIEMGPDTANPGRVYCAAGSMDAQDVVDGRCDFESNMRRELLEETGLDLSDAEVAPGFFAFHDHNTVVVFRQYRFAMTAAAMLDAIEEHVAQEAEPEISGAIAIRAADPQAHHYAFFMPAILEWLFKR